MLPEVPDRLEDGSMKILSPQSGIDPRYGGGRHDVELMKALAGKGHHVRVVIPRSVMPPKLDLGACDVRTLRFGYRGLPAFASVGMGGPILAEARRFRPDVIRVHSPYTVGPACLVAGRITKIPTAATFHHRFEKFAGAERTERRLDRYDHVFAPSEFTRDQLLELVPGLEGRVSVIYGGVAESFLGPSVSVDNWRSTHRVAGGPLFVSVGVLIERKNHLWLIDRFTEWLKAGNEGTLVIVGVGPDRGEIERRAAPLGERFRLWKHVGESGLVDLLHAADALLFPSLVEGFGLAVVESLACGTPAIVSDRGALPEVVRHGETGYVLPLEDPGAWNQAMTEIASDEEMRRELGNRGSEDVRARFTWSAVADRTLEVYERLSRR